MDIATGISILTLVSLIISVCTYVYKAGRQSAKIEANERRVEELEDELKELNQRNKSDIEEIKNLVNNLNNAFTRLETSLCYIEKELKNASK